MDKLVQAHLLKSSCNCWICLRHSRETTHNLYRTKKMHLNIAGACQRGSTAQQVSTKCWLQSEIQSDYTWAKLVATQVKNHLAIATKLLWLSCACDIESQAWSQAI